MATEDINGDGACDVLDCRVVRSGPRLLYSRLMTAAWLDENATFQTSRGHTLVSDGGSDHLIFTAGTTINEKLFEVPLVPASSLSDNHTYAIHIKSWAAVGVLNSDDDLIVGISDGTNVLGLFRADPSNMFFGYLFEGTDGPNLLATAQRSVEPPSPSPHHAFELALRVGDSSRAIAWSGPSTLPATGTYSMALDRTKDWSFVVFANDMVEQYQLYGFHVSVVDEGPP